MQSSFSKKRRCYVALTFALALVAIVLQSVAMATDRWVVADPVRIVDRDTVASARNVTGRLDDKFRGHIHFGLFHGYKQLNHGLGVREGKVDVSDEADRGLFNMGLWVSVLVTLCLAIVWGLVAMAFAGLNIATTPIETLTGPLGLYLWNLLAMLFSMSAFILYLVLFVVDLRKNVLSPDDRANFNWTSDGRADLNYSFYLVVIATVLYGVNIVVVFCSGAECKPLRQGSSEKALDGVMMY